MNRKEFADFLLPNITKTVEDYEIEYPLRNLKDGTIVTRFAPSPTGFVHMGSLFSAFMAQRFARQTDGIFFLRIEDTDQKRSVENGIVGIVNDLKDFNITIDEGMIGEDEEIGVYGPYLQSNRKEIYQAFAKHLIEKDLAYPCFCTTEELEDIRKKQEDCKARIGYYGKWAKYRNLSMEEAIDKIKKGEPYIIRLKSLGDFDKKVVIDDLVKGRLEFPEDDMDIVIIKADGLPTYHFAHLVDDHLMRTTHVIRGDEWVSSLPLHIGLFKTFGFKAPKYAHISPVMKEEDGHKRKLSKRKDPEAAVSYYHEMGIPYEAVSLYLMTIANSNFEEWLNQNPTGKIEDFKLEFKKISSSGSLFDTDKLFNISKNYISRLTAEEVYNRSLTHALEFDIELAELLKKYKEYSIGVFNIEREQKKPRKDLSAFKEVKEQIWYMFDEYYHPLEEMYEFQTITDKEEIKNILKTYIEEYYRDEDDKDTWFSKMKEVAKEHGYAEEVKEYKENPDKYKGHVGDISMVLRVALTTKSMTPDLYELMKLLGKDRIQRRYENFF